MFHLLPIRYQGFMEYSYLSMSVPTSLFIESTVEVRNAHVTTETSTNLNLNLNLNPNPGKSSVPQ